MTKNNEDTKNTMTSNEAIEIMINETGFMPEYITTNIEDLTIGIKNNALKTFKAYITAGIIAQKFFDIYGKKFVKVFNKAYGACHNEKGFNKDQRSCAMNFADIGRDKSIEWFIKTNQYKTSIKSLWNAFNSNNDDDKKVNDKTDYERIMETFNLFKKRLNDYDLTETETLSIKTDILALIA